jgi:Na+-transporting methylmalonyl-CoA/oxaloacetate decarboxylase beta subunit
MIAKLKQILAQYGPLAFGIYMTLFFVVLLGFYVAITAGLAPESVAGRAGAFTAAYLATKLTQPLRIAATVVLTPVAGRLWQRRRPAVEPANPAA